MNFKEFCKTNKSELFNTFGEKKNDKEMDTFVPYESVLTNKNDYMS